MTLTPFFIIAAILVHFLGVTTADGCYTNGMTFGDIIDEDIGAAIKDFCLDHHGAPFKENWEAKGCVDTVKDKKTESLNITIEFTSIMDESKAVNFTADACEQVLSTVAKKCDRGGEGINVNYGPNGAALVLRKVGDESDSSLDEPGPMQNIQGRDAGDTPAVQLTTTETSLIFLTSTIIVQPPETTKTDGTVPRIIEITTTLPITLTITAAIDASSTSTITTTTTSTTTSITTSTSPQSTTTTTITTPTSSSVTTLTTMNSYFAAKIKMDPNQCGCAHCAT
ncbi:hypothetical protein DHEL01_v209136 [Diaporthe helianthi]|uniref:Uncharacterized protein n=1 Tax=Diaporthe helianthi TaxID=158607 RepID=A0A2P5HQH1_DIAHE|nr:hypothetical protein DHEL01_v209136 [Diaporthe helianthi]